MSLSRSARPTVEIDQWRSRSAPTQPPSLPKRRSRKAYTRPMSNLIAKIRHWLHLDKKPKT